MDYSFGYQPKKILVNGITLEGANVVPLLLKVKKWQGRGMKVDFIGNKELEKQIKRTGLVKNYNFIYIEKTKKISSRFQFIFESLRRNVLALFYISGIKGRYDVVYSISSVLDSILFPYALKKTDKTVKWLTVFDNTVPLFSQGRIIAGNKIIRILAWLFFRLSLLFLRSADYIFVVKPELENFLVERNFDGKKIVLTGIGVEADLIKKSKKDDRYDIDALFVGRINEAKGIYDMLRVVGTVKKTFPHFQLAIMGEGDGPTKKKYEKKIEQMNLKENIQFLGHKSGQEKFDIIKSSKIFLFLSHSESFGIAPLEAVCCGLPTLTYDLPTYRDIYKNNEIISFEMCDYFGIASKIVEIFSKENFSNEIGRQLLDKYNWDNIADLELNSLMEKNEKYI